MKRLIPLLFALGVFVTNAQAADWSFWRGPEQNGVSREKDLPDSWSPDPKAPNNNLVWSAPYGGITTPIVQNGQLYLIGPAGEGINTQERVVALDADTGKLKWEYKFNLFHTDIVTDRIGWATLVGDPETGYVYAHGVQGYLFCFDKNGKVVWEHSMTEEYGQVSGYGGRTTSPIVDGDLLIIGVLNSSWGDQGMGRQRFVAFNKKTGTVEWWASGGKPPKNTYYSIPVVAVIGGQRLLVSGGGDGYVHAFKVRTGEKVWSYLLSEQDVNCSPVVAGDLIYIGHGEANTDQNSRQGRIVCLDGSVVEKGEPKEIWKRDGIRVKFASPILDGDRLYVASDTADLFCLSTKDGKTIWKKQYGKNSKGSPLLADGKIYVGGVDGNFDILKPEDKKCEILHEYKFDDAQVKGSAIAVNGKVYFQTTSDTYCIGKPNHTAKADPVLPAVKEPPLGANPKVAHLQILPADVMLTPGESVAFTVRAFDDKGRLIGETKGDWVLAGQLPPEGLPPPPPPKPGDPPPAAPPPLKAKLSEASGAGTTLTIDAVPAIQAGRLLVKAGNLTGEARVRVVPKLPFAADFSKVPEGRTPAGWVNCQGKFAVVKDGEKMVLKKLANNGNALVCRANAFIASPHLTEYTISADVMGEKVGNDQPDIGVVANRYRLELVGNTQTLRLTSWDALPRVDKTIAYQWQPKVWYSVKLRVDVKGDKTLIRGKVWERGKEEPKGWTVEFEDPTPNKEGSPALYSFATGITDSQPVGAAGYFDNVKIVPNKAGEPKPETKP
jgi:outer membrane protein assembly factor BamB